jgi:hypothetical protein
VSLPTYAVFFDSNHNKIAHQFVNVGWWVDADNFASAVYSLAIIPSANYIELYGIKVPTKILPQYRDKENLKDWNICREEIQKSIDDYVKLFNTTNSDIKNIVKEYYIKTNGDIVK